LTDAFSSDVLDLDEGLYHHLDIHILMMMMMRKRRRIMILKVSQMNTKTKMTKGQKKL
jgi:hypothetical protein